MSDPHTRDDAADPHDLDRFVRTQEGVYARALAEVRSGRKQSHWMWYIFPQFEGLGSSATPGPVRARVARGIGVPPRARPVLRGRAGPEDARAVEGRRSAMIPRGEEA